MARRICGSLTAFFFDDSGVLDTVGAKGSGVYCVQRVYSVLGAVLDEDKSQSLAPVRIYLGQAVDAGREVTLGVMRFSMKPGLRESLVHIVDRCFELNKCTSGDAATIRGKYGWAATSTYGKCGRTGQAALVRRQYFDEDTALDAQLAHSLAFLRMLAIISCRVMCLFFHAAANASEFTQMHPSSLVPDLQVWASCCSRARILHHVAMQLSWT